MNGNSATPAVRVAGFTLLELLVAMAIFALVGVMSLGGLNAVLGQQDIASRQLQRLQQVQRAIRIMATDFSQLNPRMVRDQLGSGLESPLMAECRAEGLVCFSRDGWRNPFWRQPRGTLQRVRYRLEDGKIIREHWHAMDITLSDEPRREVLLDKVTALEVEFLDRQGELQSVWPPDQTG
ncbi:MAG: type II secretion system minor pseudopilin GspJ, partial [Gammaproteobacteria bacterium]|nr:type II secretion system minor pseudopilin GspJ [Gammaproteobacteria bacterium]